MKRTCKTEKKKKKLQGKNLNSFILSYLPVQMCTSLISEQGACNKLTRPNCTCYRFSFLKTLLAYVAELMKILQLYCIFNIVSISKLLLSNGVLISLHLKVINSVNNTCNTAVNMYVRSFIGAKSNVPVLKSRQTEAAVLACTADD